MQLNKVRASRIKNEIHAECDQRGIAKPYANEAATYAETLLNEYGVSLCTALKRGVELAISRQLRVDKQNRVLLRQVIGTN